MIMHKQPEITDSTKQAFVDAFCFLYSQKPLEKITVQEIARKAGYNRGTFYQYFLDIDELLNYAENDLLDYIREKRGRAGANGNSFIGDLVELYETKAIYVNAMLGDFGGNRFSEKLKTESKLDIPELDLPDDHPLKPYLVEFHLSTSLSLFRLWLRRGKDLPVEELITMIADLYNGAISEINIGSSCRNQARHPTS